MAQTTADRATARFKQLCCLGIGGEAVMPALVRELGDIVPSYGAGFFFADEQLRLANSYSNYTTPYYDKLYFEYFHGRAGDLTGTFPNAIKTEFGVRDIDELSAFDGIDARPSVTPKSSTSFAARKGCIPRSVSMRTRRAAAAASAA